jgi:hypothetical protein
MLVGWSPVEMKGLGSNHDGIIGTFHMLSSVDDNINPLISDGRADFPVNIQDSVVQLNLSTYYMLRLSFVVTMKKKVRLEFYDRTGVKHTLAIEGDFTVERIRQLLEYAEIVAGSSPSPATSPLSQDSKMNRLVDVVNTQLSNRSFDSREVWRAYREIWGDDFSLGAVSTYLSRLVDRGTLERAGSPAHWYYKLKPTPTLSR